MLDIPKEIRVQKATCASSFITKYNHKDVYNYYCTVHSYSKTMKQFNISSKGTVSYIINKYKNQIL